MPRQNSVGPTPMSQSQLVCFDLFVSVRPRPPASIPISSSSSSAAVVPTKRRRPTGNKRPSDATRSCGPGMSETGLCTTPRATSVAAAAATTTTARSVQAWRAVVSVVGIVFGLLLQILRGTPSLAQLLSFVGLRHPLLSSAASPSPVYKRLAAVETPTEATEIVLDLDETLICAYETSSLPSNVRKQAMEAGLKCFDLECLSAEKDIDGKQRVNYVTVFERPGLREFLKQSSEFADLVLFTAGLEDYARPVVDKIDVDNKLDHRLYRPATVSTQYREHVKDLSCLSKDLRRIVIVDNNPFSFVLQPLNGIPCVPFSAGQPCDDQLIGVILPLLKHLSLQKDIRPVLHEKFHMPEWFEQHGIPSTDCTA